jgi:hypothetical protein
MKIQKTKGKIVRYKNRTIRVNLIRVNSCNSWTINGFPSYQFVKIVVR